MHGAERTIEAEPDGRAVWIMLFALGTAFSLSQAYRTVGAMMANQLQRDFALSAQQLGLFAGIFHFSFGGLQLLMGVGIDFQGVRRTILAAFPLTIAGAVLSALASDYALVVLGQALIGIGCAPAFLVCTVFIARRFPPARFASVSGLVMGLGGLGMLLTGTPLAWVVEISSWRTAFLVLAAGSALAWLAIFALVREAPPPRQEDGDSVLAAARKFLALFAMPHTWGIVALSAVTYASFITLRGLWLGPLLIERYGYSLLQSGNVALAVSIVALFGPPVFGRLDPPAATRRRWILAFTLAMAGLFALLAFVRGPWAGVAGSLLIGFLTGFVVWQYADVRRAYPEALTGRAMAVFTMAMFLGIALMQWFTGVTASIAQARQADPFTAVLLATAALLLAGAAAFALLPAPRPEQGRA
ncbi:MAG: MFS transporter [Ramlibacter sp.]|nr:MFS transporter [Ramlibacter sp.]